MAPTFFSFLHNVLLYTVSSGRPYNLFVLMSSSFIQSILPNVLFAVSTFLWRITVSSGHMVNFVAVDVLLFSLPHLTAFSRTLYMQLCI